MNCWLNTLKLKVVSSILHTCVHRTTHTRDKLADENS
jgi:hypothetical protein